MISERKREGRCRRKQRTTYVHGYINHAPSSPAQVLGQSVPHPQPLTTAVLHPSQSLNHPETCPDPRSAREADDPATSPAKMTFLSGKLVRLAGPASRLAATRAAAAPRAFGTSAAVWKSATETVKDGLKAVDRTVSENVVIPGLDAAGTPVSLPRPSSPFQPELRAARCRA